MGQSTTTQIVCSNCLAINRVPAARLSDSPVCGKCKQALVPHRPLVLTDANFPKMIAHTQLPLVVDFWAAWCGPCRMMAPAFEEAARQLWPTVLLAKLDTEAAPVTASAFRVSSIPTLIAFQQGREIDRQAGALSAPQIVSWVRAANHR